MRGVRPYPNLIERHILASLNKPFECWPYPGYKSPNGYALVYMKGRRIPVHAHVAAYRMCVGPVPDGMELDHLCRNPACCNPNHLEPVTHRVNMLRSPSAASGIAARKTHCKRGHPLSGDNLLVTSQGRQCRTCQSMRQRTRYHRAHGRTDAPPKRNTSRACIHGHEWTPENTQVDVRGHRHCRECRRAIKRRYLARTRQSAASEA